MSHCPEKGKAQNKSAGNEMQKYGTDASARSRTFSGVVAARAKNLRITPV
jgi:hypothetical protein